MEALKGEYRPKQFKMHPRLFVVVEEPGEKVVRLFRLRNTSPTCLEDYDDYFQDEEFDLGQISNLSDAKEAQRWTKRYNVMVLTVDQSGVDVTEQVEKAVAQHFETYRDMFHNGELRPAESKQWY